MVEEAVVEVEEEADNLVPEITGLKAEVVQEVPQLHPEALCPVVLGEAWVGLAILMLVHVILTNVTTARGKLPVQTFSAVVLSRLNLTLKTIETNEL